MLTLTSLRYLIADYERRNFSVSQCRWDSDAQANIVPISSIDQAGAVQKCHISKGTIAGIAIGCFLVLLIIMLSFCCMRIKRRNKISGTIVDSGTTPSSPALHMPEIEGVSIAVKHEIAERDLGEVDGRERLEINGRESWLQEIHTRGSSTVETQTAMPVELSVGSPFEGRRASTSQI